MCSVSKRTYLSLKKSKLKKPGDIAPRWPHGTCEIASQVLGRKNIIFQNSFKNEFVKIREFYLIIIFVIFFGIDNLDLKSEFFKFLGSYPTFRLLNSCLETGVSIQSTKDHWRNMKWLILENVLVIVKVKWILQLNLDQVIWLVVPEVTLEKLKCLKGNGSCHSLSDRSERTVHPWLS